MEKEYKWPADWQKLKKDFQIVFHMSMVDIYDPLISWLYGRFQIDILAFDARLHQKHEDYLEDGMSIEDIVKLKYGQAGIELLNKLI